jgi:hypothetical protein
MASLLKKKRGEYFHLRVGSVTKGLSDLELYPREESLWKYLKPLVPKMGPIGAVLSIFQCLKQIHGGDWVTASTIIFGDRNFLTDRRDLIEESERLQNSESLKYVDRAFVISKGLTIEQANRYLVPDLMMVLMEESPKKVRVSESLEGMNLGELEEVAKKLKIQSGHKTRDQLLDEITQVEGVASYVFQSQDLPNLDWSWPFYFKGQLHIISKSHPKNLWLGKLFTIPQMIINMAFSEWLGRDFGSPDTWSGGENMVPALLSFEAHKVTERLNREKWVKVYDQLIEKFRYHVVQTKSVDQLRDILANQNDWLIMFEKPSKFAKEREDQLNLGEVFNNAKYEPIEIIIEGVAGLVDEEEDDDMVLRGIYFLYQVNDVELLAEYYIQMMTKIALDIGSVTGYSKFFKKKVKIFEDFGLLMTVAKMAFPSEPSNLNPETILAGYQRFSADARTMMKTVKIFPPKFPPIKSTYPQKKEKRKIKFSSPNK